MATGITYVQPPARTRYGHGLLDVAQYVAADPLRTPYGWETTACIQGGVWETDECLKPDPDTQEKKPGEPTLTVSGDLFTPYSAADPCLRGQILDRANRQAYERFEYAVEKLVSERFWARQLAPAAEDVHPGGPLDPLTAVGLLETELRARYGAIGLLHAPALFSPWATYMNNMRETTPRRTILDTVWVIGGGYPADPDSEVWLYATGAVKVMYSDDVRVSAFDTRQNMILALAERPHGIAIDCNLVLGARVGFGNYLFAASAGGQAEQPKRGGQKREKKQ